MADCEVCGDGVEAFIVLIEGAKLRVCRDCARGEKVLASIAPPAPRPGKSHLPQQRVATEMELVPDYGEKLRRARERMHIGTDVLAELVREKESFIKRIESGSAKPGEGLGKRLMRELGIKIYEEVAIGDSPLSPGGKMQGGITLGDLIVVKKKGKGD